jgi:hypothetical protein
LCIHKQESAGLSFYQRVTVVALSFYLIKWKTKSENTSGKELLKRQIESTDKQIDQLVYKLYDLTEEEIKIVESQT